MRDNELIEQAGMFIERHESGLFGVGSIRSIFASRRYFRTYSAAMEYAIEQAEFA